MDAYVQRTFDLARIADDGDQNQREIDLAGYKPQQYDVVVDTVHAVADKVDTMVKQVVNEEERQARLLAVLTVQQKPKIYGKKKDLNPVREYQNRAKRVFEEKGALSRSTDIVIAGEMLEAGYYQHEIKRALETTSPEAAGQNRGFAGEYAKNVVKQAMEIPDVQRTIKQLSQGLER